MIKSILISLIISLSLVSSSLLLTHTPPRNLLDEILAKGELRVASTNGPTTYYEGPEGLAGLEYGLVKGFTDSLGVKLVIEDEPNPAKILEGLTERRFDLAAASLSAVKNRSAAKNQTDSVIFATPFMHTTQQLVYRNGTKKPKSLSDLLGKEILMVDNSSHSERLAELRTTFPHLEWRLAINAEMIDLLDMLNKGEADYAVVDSALYALHQYSYPNTQLAFDVTDPLPLAWAMLDQADHSLYQAAKNYLASIKADGSLAKVTHEFFNRHIEEVTTTEAIVFSYRLEKRLNLWVDYMKEAAKEFNLDWQLLAAVSYQESHWEPDAVSYTGVRGLMMLTEATAQAVGITDRENPQQSIYGGAKYLRMMLDRVPQRIQGDDRLYMALAAYNQGLGHIEDGRVLTERMGGDPNKWEDVKKYLPLLAKQQYYTDAKHGYMRGWEPVKFVDNVINYHKILAWHQKQEEFRLATSDVYEKLSRNFDAETGKFDSDAGYQTR
jgi:membrane-bound lytic murein transglycosylase F